MGAAWPVKGWGNSIGRGADHEAILQVAHAASERRVEWRALLDLGKLWASRDYNQARDCFERALELARQMDDPAPIGDYNLGRFLEFFVIWHINVHCGEISALKGCQGLEGYPW